MLVPTAEFCTSVIVEGVGDGGGTSAPSCASTRLTRSFSATISSVLRSLRVARSQYSDMSSGGLNLLTANGACHAG